MRKPDPLKFPEPLRLAPVLNPVGALRHRRHLKPLESHPEDPRAVPPPGRLPAAGADQTFPGDPPRVPAEPSPWTFFRERPGGPGRALRRAGGRRVSGGRGPRAPAQVEVAPACPRLNAGPGPCDLELGSEVRAPPRSPLACALCLLPTVLVCLSRFLSSRLPCHPSLAQHAPTGSPTSGTGELCAPMGSRAGVSSGPGTRWRPTGGRGARGREERSVPAGRGPSRPSQGIRPSPSVGPKLLKLQKCAGACPPTANKTAKGKANMALLKMEPRLPERSFPPLSLPSSIFSVVQQRYSPLLSFPCPLPHYPFPLLLHKILSLLFLLFFPLSVPFSILCHQHFASVSFLGSHSPAGLTLFLVCVQEQRVVGMVRLGSELIW